MQLWTKIAAILTAFMFSFGFVALCFIVAAVITFETKSGNGDK